jgi:hypothetical protein
MESLAREESPELMAEGEMAAISWWPEVGADASKIRWSSISFSRLPWANCSTIRLKLLS